MKKIWFKFFHTQFLGETAFLSLDQVGAAARILAVIAADGDDGFLSLPAEIWARKIGAEKSAFFSLLDALNFCAAFSFFVSEDGNTVAVSASMIESDADERAAKSRKNAAYRSKVAALRTDFSHGEGVSEIGKRSKKDREKTEKSSEKVGYASAEKRSEEEERKKEKERKEKIRGVEATDSSEEDVPYEFPAPGSSVPAAPAALNPAGDGVPPPPSPAAPAALSSGAPRGGAFPGAALCVAASGSAGGSVSPSPVPDGADAPSEPAAPAFPARPFTRGRTSFPAAPCGAVPEIPVSPAAKFADADALSAILSALGDRVPTGGRATGEHAAESPAFAVFWQIYPNPAKNGKKEDAAFAEWRKVVAETPECELAIPLFCAAQTLADQWPKPWAPGVNPVKSHANFLRERTFLSRERFTRAAERAKTFAPAEWSFLEPLFARLRCSTFFAPDDKADRIRRLDDNKFAVLSMIRDVMSDPGEYRHGAETESDVIARALRTLADNGLREEDLELVR